MTDTKKELCKKLDKFGKDESEGENTYTQESGIYVKLNIKEAAKDFSEMAEQEANHQKKIEKWKQRLGCNL